MLRRLAAAAVVGLDRELAHVDADRERDLARRLPRHRLARERAPHSSLAQAALIRDPPERVAPVIEILRQLIHLYRFSFP